MCNSQAIHLEESDSHCLHFGGKHSTVLLNSMQDIPEKNTGQLNGSSAAIDKSLGDHRIQFNSGLNDLLLPEVHTYVCLCETVRPR